MARQTRLVMLIKNIYTLWGRKRFLLPIKYFPIPYYSKVIGVANCSRRTLIVISVRFYELCSCQYINLSIALSKDL